MWVLLFLLITFFLLVLPLWPSLHELRYATDILPLKVIQEYDTNIRHFAIGLRDYLGKQFPGFFTAESSAIGSQEGLLPDGAPFVIVNEGGELRLNQRESKRHITNRLLLGAGPLYLPEKMRYEVEIYSKGILRVGERCELRALMSEDNIDLDDNCTVLRWVDSGGSLYAGSGCRLFGRASAKDTITLSENSYFQRLNANKIIFGRANGTLPAKPANGHALEPITSFTNVRDRYKRRWLMDGDVEVAPNRSFDGNIVSTHNLTVGKGAHIMGSLKSNKDLYLFSNVRVDGTVFSAGTIYMEEGCQIKGLVVAEETIVIESGSTIGSEDSPVTVGAPQILVGNNVTVYGSVWADENGAVLQGGHV